MLIALAVWLLTAAPEPGAEPRVPCRTVADCWLDRDGKVVARPKQFKGKPLPRGDCGEKLYWLRTHLTCEAKVCVATQQGDKC
jgi:hypothetical protein